MDIILYNNISSKENLNKTLTDELKLTGTLRNSTSIIRPIFTISDVNVVNKNYCYIPKFKRFYYITDITAINNNMFQITCAVDVLMSFVNDILNLDVIIDKQVDDFINKYIEDNSYTVENTRFNQVIPFSVSFEEEPKYILITAGGE